MRIYRFFAPLLVFLLAIFMTTYVFAQFDDIQDCMDNLTLETIDFDKPGVKKQVGLLDDCFYAEAASKKSSKSCSQSVDAKNCRRHFNSQVACYGELLTSGSVKGKTLKACQQISKNIKAELWQMMAQAIVKGDPALCSGVKFEEQRTTCEALALRDPSKCPNNECVDLLSYAKAVKDKNTIYCSEINTLRRRMMCLGAAGDPVKACLESSGFQLFKVEYCGQLFKKTKSEGKDEEREE